MQHKNYSLIFFFSYCAEWMIILFTVMSEMADICSQSFISSKAHKLLYVSCFNNHNEVDQQINQCIGNVVTGSVYKYCSFLCYIMICIYWKYNNVIILCYLWSNQMNRLICDFQFSYKSLPGHPNLHKSIRNKNYVYKMAQAGDHNLVAACKFTELLSCDNIL